MSSAEANDIRLDTTFERIGDQQQDIDADGFDLRSDSGRTDVEFHWVAVGRAEGHERAPEIVIPDHDEEERLQRLKEEELQSRRQKRGVPEMPGIVSTSTQ